jgi:hypothetical protein
MNERFKFPADREARNAARTKALESLLIEKGVITGETVDKGLVISAFTGASTKASISAASSGSIGCVTPSDFK